MFRIDDPTAATSLPTPEAAGTEGFWTEGNPASGVPATLIRGSWLNMIQEELCSLLAAAGITRSKTTYNQVNAALQKMYAPVIGTARNVAMSVATASATATLTADEIVVGAALGGQKYILPSFNKTINLATTGAGGMDTGTAPVSGFVALYAIWNPTTQTAALLATNATPAAVPEVYGGANMPSGYTASALVSVWVTNASSQFIIGRQRDRAISYLIRPEVAATAATSGITSIAVTGDIPKNAKSVDGTLSCSVSTNGTVNLYIYDDASGCGQQSCVLGTAASGNASSNSCAFRGLKITTAQTLYYQFQVSSGGSVTGNIQFTGYTF